MMFVELFQNGKIENCVKDGLFSRSLHENQIFTFITRPLQHTFRFSSLHPGAICPKWLLPVKVKSNAHIAIWHFSSCLAVME